MRDLVVIAKLLIIEVIAKLLIIEVVINALYVALIAYALLPQSGFHFQPSVVDCLVGGATLFCIGRTLKVVGE